MPSWSLLLPAVSARRCALACVLAGMIAALVPVVNMLRGGVTGADRADVTRINAELVQVARAYLADACRRERRLIHLQPILAGEGVMIDLRPTVANLNWFTHLRAAQVLTSSPFVFVEQDLRNTTRGALSVTARKEWWEPRLRRLVPSAARAALRDRLKEVGPLETVEAPVSKSLARYALITEDVSTLEDRRHWVARSRVRLVDRRSRALVAEYLGFATDLTPAWEPRGTPAWSTSEPCPGEERHCLDAEGRFDVVAFLLRARGPAA